MTFISKPYYHSSGILTFDVSNHYPVSYRLRKIFQLEELFIVGNSILQHLTTGAAHNFIFPSKHFIVLSNCRNISLVYLTTGKAYCNMYKKYELWIGRLGSFNYFEQFTVAYHHAVKKILDLPKRYSNSIVYRYSDVKLIRQS